MALSAETTFTELFSFCAPKSACTDGNQPLGGLTQATNGDLYGTTSFGGANGDSGTVFKITPSGALMTLYSFCAESGCVDGSNPWAGLVQATNGDLYGTTHSGGANLQGTLFKITPSGALTTVYSFCAESECTDGSEPQAGLVLAANGDLYGTTWSGGAIGGGSVFKISNSGKYTTVYSFCSKRSPPNVCMDGVNPLGGLVIAASGELYGTTSDGGAGYGTIFKLTTDGALTTLYSFCSQVNCNDGYYPRGALVQATNGDFYGTTSFGGANGRGTVFKITPSGVLTTLHSFCAETNCTDGEEPLAGLVLATDGNLYGVTTTSGAKHDHHGTVFKITPSGKLTTLHTFCSQTKCADGDYAAAVLFQATNGTFYGTTQFGGAHGDLAGTLFSLSVGLGPFVEIESTSGKAGKLVTILGTDLAGATRVSFNGTAAEFNVLSTTEITATVPAGATTGKLTVVTPGGTLESNVRFIVLP